MMETVAAHVAQMIAIHLDPEDDEAQATMLRSYIAVSAGRLAALEGPDHTMTVLSNVSAALCGGRG